ncbi:MAG: TonB-dependent receptor [Myxococcota bacterium]
MHQVSLYTFFAVAFLIHGSVAFGADVGSEALEPEVIRVTAQKRAQTIDEVPATLNVVNADEIDFAAGNDMRSTIERVPGAAFIGLGFSGSNSVSLRGIGGLATFGPFDSAVSFTIDEQIVPLRSADALFLDVERIEVLKGPQGALYGRSTLGGAVNIVTREMTKAWEALATAEAGTDGFVSLDGASGGAITDWLLFRAAARFTDFDGDVDNTPTDDETNGAEIFAARASAKALFSDDTFLKLTFQLDREERTPTGDLLGNVEDFPFGGQSGLPRASRDTERLSGRLESDLGWARLVAIGGFENTNVGNDFDLTDSRVAPLAFGVPIEATIDPNNDRSVTDTDEETISAEIRLQSEDKSDFQWLLGVSYLSLAFDRRVARRSVIEPFNTDEASTNENVTYGVFGDVSYALLDNLTLGGGLRVARDEVDYTGTAAFFGPLEGTPTFSEESDFTDTYLAGNMRVVATFGDVSAFARYARGFASGGFGEFAANALVGEAIDAFDASTSHSVEVGTRGNLAWLDYTVAGFYNAVSDGQVYQFDATTFTNVSENLDFETYGLELDSHAIAAPWAVFDLGVALQEAEFRNVSDTNLSGTRDGNRVPLSPEFTINAGLSGQLRLESVDWLNRVYYSTSVQHIGERASDPANSFFLDEYTIVNARAGLSFGYADIYVFGANLTDERAALYGQNYGTADAPIPTVNVNRGRVLGVGLSGRL